MDYQKLKEEFGRYASWGVWDPNDVDILPNDLTPKKSRYMFVGLNASQAEDERIWGNFHCRHRGGKDANLRDALTGTEYEGAYLTDILKYANQPLAYKVRKYFKKYPEELQAHFDKFFREIDLLGDVEIIFVFGKDALYYVLQCEDKIRAKGVQHIIPLIHYSAPKMYKKGAYRDYFQKIIKEELSV